MYDVASSILQQKLAQVDGRRAGHRRRRRAAGRARRGQPDGAQQRRAWRSRTSGAPLAAEREPPEGRDRRRPSARGRSATTDQLLKAGEYRPLVVAYQNGGAAPPLRHRRRDRLGRGHPHGRPRQRQAGGPAHHLPPAGREHHRRRSTASGPCCRSSRPRSRRRSSSPVVLDRTTTIRASVRDVADHARDLDRARDPRRLRSSCGACARRSSRASPCPSRSSGRSGSMYLLGYSIDNLSLMALTIATGFVVDDAIVVIENITRHLETGMTPIEAALRAARTRSASPSSRSASRSSRSSSRSC